MGITPCRWARPRSGAPGRSSDGPRLRHDGHVALAAAAETGIDAEVIDLRTLVPLDLETIVASVQKTGRCVIVHEATQTSGFGAELSALVQETCFLSSGNADRARDRLGYALSACSGMGLLPGSGTRRARAARSHGGVIWPNASIKLPDVGEGVAEAELVEWHVKSAISSRRMTFSPR